MLIAGHVICIHVLGVNHEASVLTDYTIILLRCDQFMSLCYFVFRDEHIANVRRPKVLWRLALTAESFLKLRWMADIF